VISKVRSSADSTTCLSNLRQIGVAISLYATDHSGYLPGPSFSVVSADYTGYYNANGTVNMDNSLVGFLTPYLGLPPIEPWEQHASIFMCPSFLRTGPYGNMKAADSVPYCIQQNVATNGKVTSGNITGANTFNPWGYGSTPPLKLTQLSEALAGNNTNLTMQGDLSQTWAITDNDQLIGNPTAGWYFQIPATPVHGSYRNTLFFDWHAAQLPTSAIVQK
jgi:prepilin-type processing-associated H-X9-DG protein